jgi:sugar lactone lactonase YvrE
MSLARDIIDRVFFPNRDVHAIPVLDGGFSSNERLEQARQIGEPFNAPDALALDNRGTLFVSAGTTVFACTRPEFETRKSFVEFETNAGGLAWSERTGLLLVCVSGRGVCAIDKAGKVKHWLEVVDGEPIHCPTAVTVAGDGTVLVTDGSRHNTPDQWLPDLMEKRPPSGRLIACDQTLSNARLLVKDLDWPFGAAIAHDEQGILISETWTHRLNVFDRSGNSRRILVKNFTGYPCADRAGCEP